MNNNKPIIIISAVILILIVIVVYMFSSSGEGNDDFSDEFLMDNTEEKFTYDDMMQQNEGNFFDGNESEDNDEYVELNIGNSAIDGMIDTNEDFYSNEEDQIIKEIEAEIANEYRGNTPNYPTNRNSSNRNNYPRNKQQERTKSEDDGLGERVNVNELNNFNGNGSSSFTNHIKVKIFEDKKVSTGSVIKLITTKQVVQNGIKIPVNTILTGIVDIEQNRVKITVNSIRTNSGPISCNLKAYDLNGNEGLLTTNKQIEKEAVNDASNGGGTIIKTPIGDIGKDIFQKKLNANTVSLKMHTNLVLK